MSYTDSVINKSISFSLEQNTGDIYWTWGKLQAAKRDPLKLVVRDITGEMRVHFCKFFVLLRKEFKNTPVWGRCLGWQKCLQPSPRTRVQFLGLTWWKVWIISHRVVIWLYSNWSHRTSALVLLRCLEYGSPIPQTSEYPHFVLVNPWNYKHPGKQQGPCPYSLLFWRLSDVYLGDTPI